MCVCVRCPGCVNDAAVESDRSHGERLQRTERRCVPRHLDTVQPR